MNFYVDYRAHALTLAVRTQKKRAHRGMEPQDLHVVYEDMEYHVVNDYDLDTFYYGARVIATVLPDGEIQFA